MNIDLTDEEIDKIRHDYCDIYNVPYEYIFPNKEIIEGEWYEKQFYIL